MDVIIVEEEKTNAARKKNLTYIHRLCAYL